MGDGGETLLRQRRRSPRGSYRATLACLVEMIRDLEHSTGQHGSVGVGIPGTISPASGLVKNANSTWLIGKPFDRDLAAALGRPVRVQNDANCFAVSEATDGAAAGAGLAFGVILGTGVGGGIAIEGRPLGGRTGIAGEWGHNPLPWPRDDERPGPACYCGRHGCIETFLSGPGLLADHQGGGGAAANAEDLVAQAAADDPLARSTLDRYLDRLARGLATVINVLDPDIIVLGGGLSNIDRLYAELPERLPAYVFSDRCDTPVVPPRFGDASGVRGAAWLWPPRHSDRDAQATAATMLHDPP